jgi:predicted dehydrogenase
MDPERRTRNAPLAPNRIALNLGTVRPSEDILWSFAPHDFAAMIHLLDAAPTRVRAIGGAWLRENRSDVTVTHLDFQNGVKGHVHVSWLHPEPGAPTTVVGDRKWRRSTTTAWRVAPHSGHGRRR